MSVLVEFVFICNTNKHALFVLGKRAFYFNMYIHILSSFLCRPTNWYASYMTQKCVKRENARILLTLLEDLDRVVLFSFFFWLKLFFFSALLYLCKFFFFICTVLCNCLIVVTIFCSFSEVKTIVYYVYMHKIYNKRKTLENSSTIYACVK